jgi:hypothetical protein
MKDEEKKILSPSEAAAQATAPFDVESDLPPDADVEERFNEFWKKNGPAIFGGIGLIAIIVLGFQLTEFLKLRGEANLQDDYAALSTSEARLEFAQKHEDKPLGGLAYLELADESYRAESFLEASNYYEKAIEALAEGNAILIARARLGCGIAYLKAGDTRGLEWLDDLANDPDALETIRAEAAYNHAYATWEDSKIDEARRSLDLLATFSDVPEWQAAGQNLRNLLPAAEVAPAS